MKILNFALLFLYLSLSCSFGNPVKRDGVVYRPLSEIPQGEIPIIINDQSDESMSTETIPVEFPLDKAISVDQMIFKDGEWQEVEKPKVVIKRVVDESSWVNKEESDESPIKVKNIHGGIGKERKDQFDSQPKDLKNRSEKSMSVSVEAEKIDINTKASMPAAFDRKIFKKFNKISPVKKVQLQKLARAKINSEASMSASKEARPIEQIEKIAKANSEPSMSASVESKKVGDQIIVIPLDDTNNAKEIDVIIEPEGDQIFKIEKHSASNEISYNLIDSDLNEKHIQIKTTKLTDEEEEKKKFEEAEKQMSLMGEFYRRLLSSFMAASMFGNPFAGAVAYE